MVGETQPCLTLIVWISCCVEGCREMSKSDAVERCPSFLLNSTRASCSHCSSRETFCWAAASWHCSRWRSCLDRTALRAWSRYFLASLQSFLRTCRLEMPRLQDSILYWKSFWQCLKTPYAMIFWKISILLFSSKTVRMSLAGRRVGCSWPAASYSLQIAIILDPCHRSSVFCKRAWISASETSSWFNGSESKPCHCSSMSILRQKLLSFWKAGRLAAYRSLQTVLALQRSLATTEGPRMSSGFKSSHKSSNTLLQMSKGSFESFENFVEGCARFHFFMVFLHCFSNLCSLWRSIWARMRCIASLVSESNLFKNCTACGS